MTDERYSLCITQLDSKTLLHKQFIRIADYNPKTKKMTQAEYSRIDDDLLSVYDPYIIGGYGDQLGKAGIRVWEPFPEDKKHSKSEEYTAEIYEVVFPTEFKNITIFDAKNVRKTLSSGITLPDHVSDTFLIVVSQDNGILTVLECKNKYLTPKGSRYRIENDSTDMLHTVHTLNIHLLKIYDLIDTNELRINISEFELARTRYFYRFTFLGETKEKFCVRELISYAPIFLSKYLKKQRNLLRFSACEIKKIAEAVQIAMENDTEIHLFLGSSGLNFNDVKNEFETFAELISIQFLQEDDIDQIISRSLLSSGEVLERCTKIAKERWLLEADDKRKQIERKIQENENQLDEVVNHIINQRAIKSSIENDYRNIVIETEKLETEKITMLEYQKRISDDIKNELECFKNDIVRTTALTTIAEVVADKGRIKNLDIASSQTSLLIHESNLNMNQIEYEKIINFNDFIDLLQDNLEIIGISNKFSFDTARLIAASISNRTSIVITGKSALNVANAIAASAFHADCSVITAPSGYDRISEIIECVSRSDHRVVFFENILDGTNDSLYFSLVKKCSSKFMIFSIDDFSSVEFLSNAVWDYSILIDAEALCSFPTNQLFAYGNCEFEWKNGPDSKEAAKLGIKLLKPFTNANIISGNSYILLSKVLTTCSKENESTVAFPALLQILDMAKKNNRADEMIQICKDSGISENNISLLENLK